MPLNDQVFKLLTDRLDSQDRTLAEILKQTKLTNGRVTQAERRLDNVEAAQTTEQTRRVRRGDRRRTWLEIMVAGAFVFLAGSEGEHVFHWAAHLF